jgi:ATP-binding cassette subfamily F protein 3
VKVLSGGEKARLAFCKLLLQPYNFLILDEPTNHLDLASKEVMKKALQNYDGTMLVVSHDRDFLNGLTQVVYEIKPDRLREWKGDVMDFLKEKKAESIAAFEKAKPVEVVKEKPIERSVSPSSSPDAKEQEKQKKKLLQQIQKLEKEIEQADASVLQIEAEVAALDYTDQSKADAVLKKYDQAKAQQDTLYAQWEKISEELQQFS